MLWPRRLLEAIGMRYLGVWFLGECTHWMSGRYMRPTRIQIFKTMMRRKIRHPLRDYCRAWSLGSFADDRILASLFFSCRLQRAAKCVLYPILPIFNRDADPPRISCPIKTRRDIQVNDNSPLVCIGLRPNLSPNYDELDDSTPPPFSRRACSTLQTLSFWSVLKNLLI